jgi:HAD superfamily hydrolase (TIGR01509 family)
MRTRSPREGFPLFSELDLAMIRAVIFDFNGVLVDDEHLHFELFREVLGGRGIDLNERQYHEVYLGYDDRGCFERALADAGQSPSRQLVEAMIGRKAALYSERATSGLRYFPGATHCVREMAAVWPVAVCSGALRTEIEFALRQMGLLGRIAAIIAAEDALRCKPDPEGYLLALDALRSASAFGLEAAHCLVVEDSLAGIQSAKAAGMWAVGVSNTYAPEQLRRAGADAVVRSLQELTVSWIRSFFAPEVSP